MSCSLHAHYFMTALVLRSYSIGEKNSIKQDRKCMYNVTVGRDSSVGIATGYGLDGLEIESRWGRDFPHRSRTALGTTQPPIQWVPGLSHG